MRSFCTSLSPLRSVPGIVDPGECQSTGPCGSNKPGLANHLQYAHKRDNSEKQRSKISSMWPIQKEEQERSRNVPKALTCSLGLKWKIGSIAKYNKVWSHLSSFQLQFLLSGKTLTSCKNCVKCFLGRQVPPLAGNRLQPFPSPSMRFLGKFQLLGDHCFNSLIAKGRGTRVCSGHPHPCQDGYNSAPEPDQRVQHISLCGQQGN